MLLLAGAAATTAQAEEAHNTVEFSCTSVTFHYFGFPEANNNVVTEVVYIDKVPHYKTFIFNGPEATNVFPINVPPGHHAFDARTKWNTNGVRGGRDIPDPGGITCAPNPNYTIEKLQKIAGKGSFTKETLPETHVGQTIEYAIVVRNTGNVPITLSGFSDPNCEEVTGPSENPVPVEGKAVFKCKHPLGKADGEAGIRCNVAEVTGTPPAEAAKTQNSNTVCVELPEKPNFSQNVSCKSVTFFFFGFPNVNGNKVIEMITVDGVKIYEKEFVFNGPSGSNTVTINLPPGHHTIDVRAKWKVNGKRFNFDHGIGGGLTCPAEPEFSIVKKQEDNKNVGFTESPIDGTTGEEVRYEILVTNTGNVPLTLSPLSDPKCESITGPGENPLPAGKQTAFFCNHTLTPADFVASPYTNTAEDTGTPPEGPVITHESNTVEVQVIT